jgi:hypothetical protein
MMSQAHEPPEPPQLYAVPPPDDDFDTRTPPHDEAAERAVLGAMMTSPQAITDVLPILTPTDFHRPAHELIYTAIADLRAAGNPADAVTVCAHLIDRKELPRVGGAPYLHDLISDVVSPASATYYAAIVADRAGRRALAAAGTRIAELGYAAGDDLDTITAAAADTLSRATRTRAAAHASTWAPVNLDYVLTGDPPPMPTAALMTRRDGKHLLYAGAVHSIASEPGAGKSWLALIAAAQELTAGRNVLYVDFEDRDTTTTARLLALGVPPVQVVEHLRYVRPAQALSPASLPDLLAAAADTTLAVVDGVTEAMGLHGLSLSDNEDVAAFLTLLPRRVADTGPAVLQIDHVVKNTENRGRYAIGGQHKLAGLDGVAYKLTPARAFGKGQHGTARLVIDKDRHADVGPIGATVAELHLDATEGGQLYGWLDVPGDDRGPDGIFRPTGLMEKVSRFLEGNAGASKKSIEDVVRGKREHVRTALAVLIADGHVRTEQGPHAAVLHFVQDPYREDEHA